MTQAKAKELAKQHGFRIRHDVEWQEYIVTFADGVTAHFDDINDAVDTGIWQAQRLKETA